MSLLVCDHLASPSSKLEFVNFKRPNQASGTFALLRDSAGLDDTLRLLELHKAQEGSAPNSVFIGETVKRNGQVFLLTTMDVNLLLLTLLDEESTRFVPITQLLRVDGFPHYAKLLKCKGLKLESIADVDNSDSELTLVRANEGKVLAYLLAKIDRIASHLKVAELSKADTLGGTSSFNGPVRTSAQSSQEAAVRTKIAEKESERVAMQIVCEYVADKWRTKLAETRGWTLKQILSSETFKGEPTAGSTENQQAKDAEEEGDDDAKSSAKPKTWEEANGYAVQLPNVDHLLFGTKQHKLSTAPNNNNSSSTAISATQQAAPILSSHDIANKRLKANTVPLTIAQKKIAQVKDKRGVQSISAFFGKKASE